MQPPKQPTDSHNNRLTDFDVVIVGYGPVGRLLALKLGGRGHRVLVVERQSTNYYLPRAVHFDDEASRIFQSVGVSPSAFPEAVEPYDNFYEWRAADLSTLTRLDWSGRGPSGWNVSNFFYQPALERVLSSKVEEQATVTVLNGFRAVDHRELADRVEVTLQESTGSERTVTARYVVGADGANSVVREWIGTDTVDLGYFHDWLVVDLKMKRTVVFDPPAWQLCDPARPTTLVPGGPGHRRFEFMRLPAESADELKTEAIAWQLIEPWGVTPAEADLVRHTVYTFQARYADTWRRGRLLIAGDSAHLMPPFAGQGMCSGLRDVANLEWKLDLVLSGKASEELLDSYGPERSEHVQHFIQESIALGEVICITDPHEARERDAVMRQQLADGIEMPPRPLPQLGTGFYLNQPFGGTLSIQDVVASEQGEGLFDDVTAGGGTLLLANADVRAALDEKTEEALLAVGIQTVTLAEKVAIGAVVDGTGTYATWLDSLGAVAVLVRPDFYIYGGATTTAEVPALAEAFLHGLTAPVATHIH
ncbi:hypothetical protein B7R22_16805 [Subtercola boreus]|uniref:FAD-binding domain-containing protein n=1 Tax=Subtercola boreus TaxID=120213 RepID=A0A3E0VQ14_9MICO|nr:bifunctional 3-(3-hydroxy-phenyl)propionate/3-hydroxycinnamic acid hydroxylase [Subtercola boreus]RFA12094.1 hypothetical protein B7R22_16805 [Subtercola boreus]